VGTRIAFANIEARFPIFASTELLRGVVFFDAATSYFYGQSYLDQRVRTAVGFGLRAYVGLPLRFDAALPLNTEPFDQLSVRQEWKTFFAIGFDF
jgi:translocation and assembly module TamA